MRQKFDFNDITLVPETISTIRSRKEVNPYIENGMLPLFTAPMDTVIDRNNFNIYKIIQYIINFITSIFIRMQIIVFDFT